MNAISAAKNRWGDLPLVVQGRLSRLAVWAFSLAIAAASLALLRELLTSAAGEWQPLAALLALFLTLFQLIITPVVWVLSYFALCLCRPGGARTGRGLAWAALGIVFIAFVLRVAIAAETTPRVLGIMRPLLAVGMAHLLMFTAESRFARQAVAALFIGGVFLSLLFPWIVHSREVSRRLQCADRLRQLGIQMQQAQSIAPNGQVLPPTRSAGEEHQPGLSPFVRELLSNSVEPTWQSPAPGPVGASVRQSP